MRVVRESPSRATHPRRCWRAAQRPARCGRRWPPSRRRKGSSSKRRSSGIHPQRTRDPVRRAAGHREDTYPHGPGSDARPPGAGHMILTSSRPSSWPIRSARSTLRACGAAGSSRCAEAGTTIGGGPPVRRRDGGGIQRSLAGATCARARAPPRRGCAKPSTYTVWAADADVDRHRAARHPCPGPGRG